MDDTERDARRDEASGTHERPAMAAFGAALFLAIVTTMSPAANLLLLIGCVVAFGAGAALLIDPPLRGSLPKDRVALRVLVGVIAAGALLVVLLPILGRTGIW